MRPIGSVARAMLGAVFVGSGVLALRNPDRHVQQAKQLTDQLAPTLEAAHLPTDPRTLVKVNGAVQLTGGLLLITGHATRPAAAALAASLVPSTVVAHPFWTESDPQKRAEQEVQFVKNLGLLGGLLLAVLDRGGKPSLAWRTRYAARQAGRSARFTAKQARTAATHAAHDALVAAGHTAKTARRTATHAAHTAVTAATHTAHNTRQSAGYAAKSARRTAGHLGREARVSVGAARLGRRLPF
jgi:putative oxidoreductase